ncbi:MAG: acetyl-CoA carboxylase biotin carboxyl carrier protein [Verrucomicrobia bacterium]|nr:acetyl-CoA carboxylase biotin carboxyl carrier protein [Verrucomicrobiota bacterium]
MDIKNIKRIVDLMCDNDLCEFELVEEGSRLLIRRPTAQMAPQMMMAPAQMVAPAAAAPATPADLAGGKPAEDTSHLVEVTSPMVGTFYRSPSPEAESYVNVGDSIEDESVVCIIEAMKVMNEIKAETKGVIRKILVENATSVEFGQPLFLVEPA